jgi:hypothetical protein
MRLLFMRLALAGGVAALSLIAACEDPYALADATNPNRVDTLSLWALSGTAVHLPSAYVLATKRAVRTDQTAAFDFAFDLGPGDEARLLPSDALRLTGRSGLLLTTAPFASIKSAPDGGYVDSSAVVVTVGSVLFARSRPAFTCVVATLPYYAKLHILALDVTDRRVDFEILTDSNCGYRGLEPGIPPR